MKALAILGSAGIPASYGGFETLAENLVRFNQACSLGVKLDVYCSSRFYKERPSSFMGASLHYISLNANGVTSIAYDITSILLATWRRNEIILLLGVSGAVILPLIRLISRVRVVTNVDGLEWKRQKWRGVARWFLRLSERLAVRYSHEVIADNLAISEHIKQNYGRDAHVIAYGGDHALQTSIKPYKGTELPQRYALALCRIEPENNVAMILEAFSSGIDLPLVFLGNWNNSSFGRDLRTRYADQPNLHLLDPIYDVAELRTVRENATIYVHGHSAGGTNPSLVEMMHFGLPILAYDCSFNRYTTEDCAIFFKDADSLRNYLFTFDRDLWSKIGLDMLQIAKVRYNWNAIGQAYFDLLLDKRI